MKAIVVYDSKWGNTEMIAKAIAVGIGKSVRAVQVGDINPENCVKTMN